MGVIDIPIPDSHQHILSSVYLDMKSTKDRVFFASKEGMEDMIKGYNLLGDNAFKLLNVPMYGETDHLWYCSQHMFNNFFYDITDALEKSEEVLKTSKPIP